MGSRTSALEHTPERTRKRTPKRKKSGLGGVVRLVTVGLAVAAAVKEVRRDPAERTWNGVVAGFVPYDFRMPTLDRVRQRMWNPEDEHWVGPRVFGVGWTMNWGRVVAVLREQYAAAR